MATSRHDQREASAAEGRDRRSFLRGLGIAGGTALTALVPGTGAVGAAPAKPPRRSGKILRPTPGKTPDLRTTGTVRLSPIPDPPRSPAKDTAQKRLAPAPRIRPSSRAAVLQALHTKLRLPTELQARPAKGEDVPTGPSVILGAMVRIHSLASAYVEGILLTPTGCEYSGGAYRLADPLTYHTKCGELRPSILEQRRLTVAAWVVESDGDPTSIVWLIQTPGEPSQRLAYTLEMHITATGPQLPPFSLNDQPIDFLRTRTGTLLAVVEMGGNTGLPYHVLKPIVRRGWTYIPGLEFHWLKVMAV